MTGSNRPGCDGDLSPPLNIVKKLRSRELFAWPSAAQAGRARQLCQSLLPSVTIPNVKLPDCFINRFTNSGEHLVCFGNMQHDLVLYRHLGAGGDCQSHAPSGAEPASFNRFFTMQYQKTLVHGTELLCRDFSLTAHQERYLILASSCLPGATDHVDDPGVTRIQGLVNVPGTTFRMLEMATGRTMDTYTIPNDFIHLANNSGANLYDDLLAICAVNSQTIHLVHVHPAGQLIPLQTIGQHCFPDDDLILAHQAEQEAAWRHRHQADARRIDRQRSTSIGLAYTMPLSQEAAVGSGSVDAYPQPQPSPHHDESTAGLNQDQAFLASHFPPALPGNFGGTHQTVGSLGRAHSMPPRTRSPHISANTIQAGRTESPAPADLPGGQALGNADMMARALRATQQQQQQQAEVNEEPDVPGPESEQEEVGSEVAAPQAQADGDLEAAIEALDAEAGLQGALLPAAVARSAGRDRTQEAAEGEAEAGHRVLEGFQHRFLAYFFRRAWPHGPTSDAMSKFHGMFDYIIGLVIWKVQLLDRDHLLLALGSPDASASRLTESGHHRTWLVVYRISTAQILTLQDTFSRSLLQVCVSHLDDLHNGCPSCDWERYIATPMGDQVTRRHVLRQLSQSSSGSQHQSVRRMLSAIPVSSQLLCASPYLDPCLFSYDDKLAGPIIKPRPFTSQPLKITSRAHPERCRFRVGPSSAEAPGQGSRNSKNSVLYLFHPVHPFVMCITAANAQQTRLDIFVRT